MNVRNISELLTHGNPIIRKVGEALTDMVKGIQSVGQQVGVLPSNQASAPPAPAKLSVTASGGFADVQITHNDPVLNSVSYHVEYSTTPGFTPATTHGEYLGPYRNKRLAIGMGGTNVYFRAFAQYPGSLASDFVYHGGAKPQAVTTGGSGPAMQAGQSSGTGVAGVDAGVGFGPALTRTQNGVNPSL